MYRVLVTGAAGFIGFHLSKFLLAGGFKVVGVDNLNAYYDVQLKTDRLKILKDEPNFQFKEVDISKYEDLKLLWGHEGFDVVVNLAAQAGVRFSLQQPFKYSESNLQGFLNVLEACRYLGTKHLIFASSSSVYGNTPVPFSEDAPCNEPQSFYAATKKANEAMAYSYSHLYHMPITGLRFFTVYGPWGRPDMAYFSFTKQIFEHKPIKVFNNGELLRDFTYIDDIVAAIGKLVEKDLVGDGLPLYNIFNIGNHQPVRLMDFISILEKEIGIEAIKEFLPMQDGDVFETFANIDRLYQVIGFRPSTSIEIGLKRFVDWYRGYYKV